MRIDISAELLELNDEQYYADWTIAETRVGDSETEVEIAVSGPNDAEYLDLTPIFDVITTAQESVGDAFYLKEIQFNPTQVVATMVLTTLDIRDEDKLGEDVEITASEGLFYCVYEETLQKVDYDSPPLIVGYCSRPTRLSIELR